MQADSRALRHEHDFRGFLDVAVDIFAVAQFRIRSSLQPQRIPATSPGLVKVKSCVDSFMIIHMCSAQRSCVDFENVVISLARAHISSCVALNFEIAIAICALAAARSKVLQSLLMCVLAAARSISSQCCSNISEGQILEYRFLEGNHRHFSNVVAMIARHRDGHE